MVRHLARSLAVVAGAVLYALFATAVGLFLLGWLAPPPVEGRPLDPADPAADRAADALDNLRATDYTYEMTVERRQAGADPGTTIYQRVEVDNRARAYYAVVRNPPGAVNRSRPPVRYFSDGITGYQYVPAALPSASTSEPGQWTGDDGLRYVPGRNAFDDVARIRIASATVVAANDTDLVVRVTNRSVAAAVGHPVRLDHEGENWTATLALHVDRRAGVVERGVFRYRDPAREVELRTTWRVSAVGRTHVQRPPGTLPPGPLEVFYRLDLGLRTLADLAPTATAVGSPAAVPGVSA